MQLRYFATNTVTTENVTASINPRKTILVISSIVSFVIDKVVPCGRDTKLVEF